MLFSVFRHIWLKPPEVSSFFSLPPSMFLHLSLQPPPTYSTPSLRLSIARSLSRSYFTLSCHFSHSYTVSLSSPQTQTHLIRTKFKRPAKSSPTTQSKHTKHRVPKCRLTICLQGLIIVKYGWVPKVKSQWLLKHLWKENMAIVRRWNIYINIQTINIPRTCLCDANDMEMGERLPKTRNAKCKSK